MDWEGMLSMLAEALAEVASTTTGMVVLIVAGASIVLTRGRALFLALRVAWTLARPVLGLQHNPGPWHPTWLRSAPRAPDSELARPRSNVPRTGYGRLSGFLRLVVHALAACVLWVVARWPWWALGVAGVLVMVAVVVFGRRGLRWLVYYRVTSPFVDVVGKRLGMGDKSWQAWLTLPRYRWELTPPLFTPESSRRWLAELSTKPVVAALLLALRFPRPVIPLDADDAQVIVRYPKEVAPDDLVKKSVGSTLQARLAGGTWEVEWQDSKQQAVLTHPASPPSAVWYDREAADAFDVFTIPIAKDATKEWFPLRIAKFPHVMMSASTGNGKTQTQYTFASHVAYHGARVLILDPKRKSFRKLYRDAPGMAIATMADTQAAFYDSFLREMLWRYELMEKYDDLNKDDPYELLEYFTPWYLLTDEKATLTKRFKALWKMQGGKGDAPQSEQEREMLNLARGALMFVFDAAQQGNTEAFGDTEKRDNHMNRIAAGPQSPMAWSMMFPGTKRRKIGNKKGRAVIGIGLDELTDVQLAQIEYDLARELAIEGGAKLERDEAARAARIKQVTGLSLAELSRPVPNLPGAAGTWFEVPVPADVDSVESPIPGPRVRELLPVSHLTDLPESVSTDAPTVQAEEQPADDSDDWVVTVEALAAFLEEPFATIDKARKRYKKRTGAAGIPGEKRLPDGRIAFRKSDAREWRNQHAKVPV